MSEKKQGILMLVGRILLGALFVLAGYTKTQAAEGTLVFMASAGLPESMFLVWVVIAIEILGGLALILGFKSRIAAWVLMIFTLLTIYFFHFNLQDVNFLKNLAIVGGLLYVAAFGSGNLSLDHRMPNLMKRGGGGMGSSPTPTPDSTL